MIVGRDMIENTGSGDKFSPGNGDVAEVTEVFEVTPVAPQEDSATAFVEDTVAFTPLANPTSQDNTNAQAMPGYAASTPGQTPFPQAPPYPQASPYQQAPPYQQTPPNYGGPQGGYPNPGQPLPGGSQYGGVYVEEVPWSEKSKLAAGLFGILLGVFGVHNFYLGYTGKAVAQLLITVLSFGLLSFVSAIWGLVEGILILSAPVGTQWDLDGQGLPMRPISASGA